ncbi:hypothetical protein MTP99_007379 [Tenebrio molitor]|jgi:hypothetical protein|nr:hypothetical protein MTP99_007379 [Tenebrio molitor]
MATQTPDYRSVRHQEESNSTPASHPAPSTVAKRLARHFTFGRSRVLTPVPPDQVWVFSEVSPHHHIVVCLISQIRRMLGQYQPLSTYHLPSAPILTVPIPNLPVSVAEKAERLSSPPPFGGE